MRYNTPQIAPVQSVLSAKKMTLLKPFIFVNKTAPDGTVYRDLEDDMKLVLKNIQIEQGITKNQYDGAMRKTFNIGKTYTKNQEVYDTIISNI